MSTHFLTAPTGRRKSLLFIRFRGLLGPTCHSLVTLKVDRSGFGPRSSRHLPSIAIALTYGR